MKWIGRGCDKRYNASTSGSLSASDWVAPMDDDVMDDDGDVEDCWNLASDAAADLMSGSGRPRGQVYVTRSPVMASTGLKKG